MTPELIHTLAKIANAFPPSKEWREISDRLTDEQRRLVNDEIYRIQDEAQKQKQASMTEKEKQKQQEWWDNWNKNPDPDAFFGNMGQPETPEEFKNRYGQYPYGYDEHGNRTDKA